MNTDPSNPNPQEEPHPFSGARLLVGRYRLLEKIGGGAAAEVFRSWDELLDRVVAVKLLRSQYVEDQTWRKRFTAEARAAARLSHPNIIEVYDFGEGPEGTMYIAMRYVDGQNLRDVLRQRGRLSPPEAVRVAEQLCDALAVAHAAGLVHRDVKPQNIMIDKRGSASLTDFGIAKALAGTALTQSGMAFGTAAYLSPEQATGAPLGPASDIYALGCVLYEMLSGAPPFSGDNSVAVAYKQVWEQPRPLHDLVPGIPYSLESVVMRALRKDPAARQPTALAFGADLRRAGETASAPTNDTQERADNAVPLNSPPMGPGGRGFGGVTAQPALPTGAAFLAVPPVRVQSTSTLAVPVGVVSPRLPAAGAGLRTINVSSRSSPKWLPFAAVLLLTVAALLALLALKDWSPLPAQQVSGPPASPTRQVVSHALRITPTALGHIVVVVELTPSPTATSTSTPVVTDTPVPPPTATATRKLAPTRTPVPPRPRPTKTPIRVPPTPTPAPPPPPTSTPAPPPTDTPAPPPTPAVLSLEDAVNAAIAGNPKAVSDYLKGKKTGLVTLLRDIGSRSKGQIDPETARDLLISKLEALRRKPPATPGRKH